DGVPHAARRGRGFCGRLQPAAGGRRLPEPAQRAPLPGDPRPRTVQGPQVHRFPDRTVRVCHPTARARLMAIQTPSHQGQLTSSPVVGNRALGTNHRTARLIAIIAGLLGAAMAIATPFLPVTQTTAQLNWPQNGVLQSVNAPLIGYVATDLKITVPCSAA